MDCNQHRQKNSHRKLGLEIAVAFGLIILLSAAIVYFWGEPMHKGAQGQSIYDLSLPQQDIIQQEKPVPWQVVKIKKGDSLSGILHRLHIPISQAQALLDIGPHAKLLASLMPFHTLKIRTDKQSQITDLEYHYTADKRLLVHQAGKHFTSEIVSETLEPHVHYAQATIQQSLYTAARKAGLSERLIYEMINSFAWDIDFAKDIRPGDSFSVLYNDYYVGDKKFHNGDILAASFTVRGHNYKVVRYTDSHGYSAYFTPDGHSVKKAFIRSPVKYTRISSRYNPGRYHPVLHKLRAHRGVDYAAPSGTPIKATGDGKITMRRRNGGYGNVIMIKHGVRYTTVYGHMLRFAKGLKVGSRVRQGQIIGFVGQTGLATGPHCHYEFRINGKHVNPINVKLPPAQPVPRKLRKDFLARARIVLSELALYENARNAEHA